MKKKEIKNIKFSSKAEDYKTDVNREKKVKVV